MEDKEEDKLSEDFSLKDGVFRTTHRDKNGKIINRRIIKNTKLNKGREMLAKLLNGVSVAPFTYLQIGSGTTAALATNEELESFAYEHAATCTYESNYKAKSAWLFDPPFPVGPTEITEYGVANGAHATNPDMLCRTVDVAEEIDFGETLQVEYIIPIG